MLWSASFLVTYDGEAVISKRREFFVGVYIWRAYLSLVCGGGEYLLNKFTAGILFKNTDVCWGRGLAMTMSANFWMQVSSADREVVNMVAIFILTNFILFYLLFPSIF